MSGTHLFFLENLFNSFFAKELFYSVYMLMGFINLYLPFMIAYFILVHRYPEQFRRLLTSIYDPDNYYLLHVDKRSGKALYREILEMVKQYPNVSLLDSQNVVWGGYSMVDVELKAIKKLLHINNKWEYFINLSGQDFPLKSQLAIKNYLIQNKGKNYLTFANQIKERPNTLNRIQNYYIESANGFEGKPIRRKYLKDIIPYIGGQWKILTRDCCDFITHNRDISKYRKYYRNTLIPDESFFQTVLMNTHYTGPLINDHKRAIIWIPDIALTQGKKNSTKTTQTLIDSGKVKLRPKTFTIQDKVYLLSSDALFARKFDETVDSSILDICEQRIQMLDPIFIEKKDTLADKLYIQAGLTG